MDKSSEQKSESSNDKNDEIKDDRNSPREKIDNRGESQASPLKQSESIQIIGSSGHASSSDVTLNQNKEQGKTPPMMSLRGTHFMMPGEIPASPPRFVTLEELMKAANGMTNMALAHEIAVNNDFKLEKLQYAENSVEKTVHDVIHRAFWDVLRCELAEDPPVYSQALVLLKDVKQGLLQILLPQHTDLKKQISDVLDIDLITQQTMAGTLDFQHYAQYVISVMAKLCAPIRDDKIKELSMQGDVVEAFKGILETIDLMKIDMANFTLDLIRPHIIASSVEYEKQKFSQFLAFQDDGLAETRLWLLQHLSSGKEGTDIKVKIESVLNNAYIQLLEWENGKIFPETLSMDENRILEMKSNFEKTTIIGSIMLLIFSNISGCIVNLNEFKTTLKGTLVAMIEQKVNRTVLEQVSAKVEVDIKKYYERILPEVPAETIDVVLSTVKNSILAVEDDQHRVLQLLRLRIKEFLLNTITSRTAEPIKIPVGLSSVQKELTQLCGSFLRLVSYNRSVFREYYEDIIRNALEEQTEEDN